MAAVTVDQAKLVMNTFAAIFQNNLVTSDLVTFKKFDNEMNDRNALTVVEQVGPRYSVHRTSNGVKDLSGGVQDSVFGSEQYKVQDVWGTDMGWGDFQKIRDIGDARESEAIKNAALNLAETIDAYVLGVATLAPNNWTGTIGNNVATYDDIAAAYTRLKEEGCEDADLRAVLTYADKQALGSWVVNNNDSALSGAEGIYRSGFTGQVAGIGTLFTQQLPTLTVGSRAASGSVAVNGATQNKNYKDVAISSAPSFYMSQELNITLPSGATIVAGEVFTIAGVNAYDNRKGASLGRLQQFTVITGATGSVGNTATIRIFPAIVVPGTGTGGDILVNTANATVTAAPGATAAITLLGTASTAYTPRVVMQKSSIIVNTADLITPADGISMRKSLTKLPISVRMWKHSDFDTGEHKVRFDVALTANVAANGRQRGTRLNGA